MRGEAPGGSTPKDALAFLAREGALEASRPGEQLSIETLSLADFLALRVALAQLGIVSEPEISLPCENCDESLRLRPAMHVEMAPFRDGELDDPELDARFDFEVEHAIPPIAVGRRRVRTLKLSPRTVGEARALLERDLTTPLPLTPRTVAALGVSSLGGERKASVLARALEEASDETWAAFCDLWEDAHGHPRLFASVRS